MNKTNWAAFIAGTFSALVVGVLIGRFTIVPKPHAHSNLQSTSKEDTIGFFLKEVNEENISKYLRNLTLEPHLAGTTQDLQQAQILQRFFQDNGFRAAIYPYKVLLSYPDAEQPNKVSVLSETGSPIFESHGKQPPLWSSEESSPFVQPNFNSYSASGVVEGEPVFTNYGREEDFDYLQQNNISVSGKIVIAKYGQIFRANIVYNAQTRGASGVLLYSDPADYAAEGRDFVYPDSIWMPGLAVESGTIYLGDGDPLTPLYPSTDAAYRLPESKADLPKIPVQPIGYDDAEQILRHMSNDTSSPMAWKGGLNASYALGPGFSDRRWRLKMDIRTANKIATTYNVIATMDGAIEPDRYVVLGNHRDAWIFGAMDPSSSTAAMMEIARVLGQARQVQSWTPRRSIVLCSWGAEEYGLIGSTEWAEEFRKILEFRTVAYLNVDMAIEGNYSLRALGVPLLYNILYESSKLIPNPNPTEVEAGRVTVFDTWLRSFPDSNNASVPRVRGIGSGSDYKSFQHNLGVPCLDVRYTFTPEMGSDPLYHTLYETYHVPAALRDVGFHFHASIAKLWGVLALQLSESAILPLNPSDYSIFLDRATADLEETYGELLSSQNITLDYVRASLEKFTVAADNFEAAINTVDINNPLEVRRVNDQLMGVERAFIIPWGLPNRKTFNHIVFAPSTKDSYVGESFTGLTDLLDGIEDLPEPEQSERWEMVRSHVAEIAYYIDSAAIMLYRDAF